MLYTFCLYTVTMSKLFEMAPQLLVWTNLWLFI